MNLLKDESGQAGGLIIVVGGILVVGFFYVAFGMIMSQLQTANNALITNPELSYSQNHFDAADTAFKFWGYFLIYAILLFAIWGIRNALTREPGQV